MSKLEDDIKKGIDNANRITSENDAVLSGARVPGEGCGTTTTLLALLPLGATLAAWIGGWPC